MTKMKAEKIINAWNTGGDFKRHFLQSLQCADSFWRKALILNLCGFQSPFNDIIEAFCVYNSINYEMKINQSEKEGSTIEFIETKDK